MICSFGPNWSGKYTRWVRESTATTCAAGASISDAVAPRERARAIGVYRFWRDAGFVVGALAAGFGADFVGTGPTIAAVAGLTAASGFAVAATRFRIGAGDARHRQLPLGRYGPVS